MCGYCTEIMARLALQTGHPDLPTEANPLMMDIYLQEVRNLPDYLRKLTTQHVAKPPIALPILCRAIEMLVVHGFESEPYQELLQQPQFVTAISTACAKSKHEALDDVDPRLNPSGFAWLAEKDIYFMPGCFEQHNNQTSDQIGAELLNEYIEWWLEGESVQQQDTTQNEENTEVAPIDEPPETEYRLMNCRFPALWYALIRTSLQPENKAILWAIITKQPSRLISFEGLDLWLQRHAALAYYDQQGLNPFLINIEGQFSSIRIELLEFIAAARIIKAKDKDALIAALKGRESDFSGPAEEWIWAD